MDDHTTAPDDLPEDVPLEGPHLVIRRATLDDYSTIRHVQSSAVRALSEKLLDAAEVTRAIQAIYSPAYIAELFVKTVSVAVLNGDIVGTCAWGASDDRGTAARIGALFVGPLSQRIGIGRRLVAGAERDAASNGFTRYAATAPVAVAPLFSKLGYVTASYGLSRDVIPEAAIQVAFLRKPS